jgi:hypothetical protein
MYVLYHMCWVLPHMVHETNPVAGALTGGSWRHVCCGAATSTSSRLSWYVLPIRPSGDQSRLHGPESAGRLLPCMQRVWGLVAAGAILPAFLGLSAQTLEAVFETPGLTQDAATLARKLGVPTPVRRHIPGGTKTKLLIYFTNLLSN